MKWKVTYTNNKVPAGGTYSFRVQASTKELAESRAEKQRDQTFTVWAKTAVWKKVSTEKI